MLKSLLGLAPQPEADGSFRPSWLALKLATSSVTDYESTPYEKTRDPRARVLVLLTEQKNMRMENGRLFSTGNHPVEVLVPMLHLKNAGFAFDLVTPTGRPAVLEDWAMPTEDGSVMGLYRELEAGFSAPRALTAVLDELEDVGRTHAALFIPGGHGSMLGIPRDPNVGRLLRQVHAAGLLTISICHGPGALLATSLDGHPFLYADHQMAVFPDSVDRQTPLIGYLPGHMPWRLCEMLQDRGAAIVNRKADDTCCLDRQLLTGASPAAADKLGRLAAETLLESLTGEAGALS